MALLYCLPSLFVFPKTIPFDLQSVFRYICKQAHNGAVFLKKLKLCHKNTK